MEKLKFAAQVIVLLAAFPVLFVTGISRKDAAAGEMSKAATVKQAPAAKKADDKKHCLCKRESHPSRGDKM
jgi:hypothetical protein